MVSWVDPHGPSSQALQLEDEIVALDGSVGCVPSVAVFYWMLVEATVEVSMFKKYFHTRLRPQPVVSLSLDELKSRVRRCGETVMSVGVCAVCRVND